MFFDRRCPGCGGQGRHVCVSCWSTLLASRPSTAEVATLAYSLGLDELTVACHYNARSRRILLAAKNGGRTDVLRFLGSRLGCIAGGGSGGVDLITWVPASRKMRRRRGYDQGQILARSLSGVVGAPARRLLVRQGTRSQAGATRSERLEGPDLALTGGCPPTVLVVDDVCTSGASLATATRCLRAGGAVTVVAAVVAAVGEGQPSRRLTFAPQSMRLE